MSEKETNRHHIWCNFWNCGPTETCEMCKSLREKYPEESTEEETMKKYFPNNILVSKDDKIGERK